MTLNDFNEEVVYLTGGEPINLMTIYKFVNKAMDVLANRYDTACIQKTAVINCTDISLEYVLPIDCIGVFKVSEDNNKYNSYNINEGVISFGRTGDFTLSYYAVPVMTIRQDYDYKLKSDIPPINSNYFKCMTKYIAGEILKINSPNDARINIYTNDFIQEAKEVNDRFKRLKRKNMRVKAPIWR